LKEKIIAKISSTDNEELLDHIAAIIELESTDSIYKMSSEETEAVKEGLEQFKNGQWITNEDSNKHVDEWLKKDDGQ